MANDSGQLGTVILKLMVDNKEFAEGFKNALQITAIASTQMKDLMEFKIKAPDFTALDLAVDANQKKISGLTKSQHEQAAASTEEGIAAGEAGKKHIEHGLKVDVGSKSIQQFRTEQRLQNFVVRQSSQALLGATTALGFLTLGNKDAEGSTKKVQTALLSGVMAANGMEFALFGMGQAAKNMNGQLGVTIRNIAGMAGPIAAVIGIGAGLIAFFSQEESHLKEINDRALDGYIKRLGEAGGQSTVFLQKVTASLEAQKKSLTELQNVSKNLGGGALTTGGSKMTEQAIAQGDVTRGIAAAGLIKQLEEEKSQHEEIVKKLQKEIKEQEILNEAIKRANAEIVANGSSIDRLRIQIGELNDDIAHGLLTDDERRKKIDERVAKEKELGQLMKSTQQIETEHLGVLEAHRKMRQATTEQLIKQIDKMLALKLTDQERIALEQKRFDLIQAERDLETQNTSARLAALEEEKKQREDMVRTIQDLGLQAIHNEFTKRQASEDQRFADAAKKIELEGRLQGATVDGTFLHTKESQDALAANEATHIEINAQLKKDKEDARFQLQQMARGEGLAAEIADINYKYDEAERRARELYENDRDRANALAALKIARERDLAQVSLANFQRTLGGARSIMQNIVGIAAHLDPEAQEFVDTLSRAIDIAQAIVSIISLIQSFSNPLSFLGLLGGGGDNGTPVSIFATRTQEGSVVGGSGDGDKIHILAEPGEGILNRSAVRAIGGAGAVHMLNRNFPRFGAGGIIGQLPMVQELNSLMAQVKQMQYPSIINSLAAQQNLGGFNKETMDALIDEVRNLRQDVKEMKVEARDNVDRINIKIPEEIRVIADGRELKKVLRRDDQNTQ